MFTTIAKLSLKAPAMESHLDNFRIAGDSRDEKSKEELSRANE